MRPTQGRDLLAVGLIVGVLALTYARIAARTHLAELPILPAVALGVLGLAELRLAALVRARLSGRPGTRPIAPIGVARTAAFARASSLTGAVAVGVWAGFGIDRLTRVAHVVAARHDAVVAGVGLLAAVLLVAAALRLEGVCRVPKGPGGTGLT